MNTQKIPSLPVMEDKAEGHEVPTPSPTNNQSFNSTVDTNTLPLTHHAVLTDVD
jgi:hypothetical protein